MKNKILMLFLWVFSYGFAFGQIHIEENPIPTATLVSGDAEMCVGLSTDLVIGLTEGPVWEVICSDGVTNYTLSGITTPTYMFSVSPVVTTTYSIVSVSNENCTTNYGIAPYISEVTVIVNQNPTFNFTDVLPVRCNGESNGEATVNLLTGALPANYLWDNGVTAQTNTILNYGDHDVTVTDANSCSATGTVFIDQPVAFVLNIAYVDKVNCLGGNTGEIMVYTTGGTGAVTYIWSHDATLTGPLAENLAMGWYLVTVIDANGCSDQLNIYVGQDPDVNLSITSVVHATCYDSNTGSATASATGVGPFTYLWSNGQTGATASGLHAGIYSVVVTDDNGCTDMATVTITEPSELVATFTTNNVNCDGTVLGSASVSVSGGTPQYYYAWSNGQIGSSVVNLIPGGYSVVVTDSEGCFATGSPFVFSITQDPTPIASIDIISGSNPVCFGTSVQLQASGGTSYYWPLTGETTSVVTFTPVVDTDYTVIVTNDYGCFDEETITIYVNQPATITVSSGWPADVCDNVVVDLAQFVTVNPYNGGAVVFIGEGISGTQFYSASVSGTTDITISYTDPTTNCEATEVRYITVHGDPSVQLDLPVNNLCLNDAQIILSGGVPVGTGGSYGGDNVYSPSPGVYMFNPINAGLSQVIYTFVDTYGCSASASDNIVVDEPIFVNLSIPANDWCTGDPMNVNVNIENAVVTANGLVLQQIDAYTFLFSPTTAGTYELIATAQSACSSEDVEYVDVGESPNVYFDLNNYPIPTEVLITDDPFQIAGMPVGGVITIDGNVSGNWFYPSVWGSPGGSVDRLIGYEVTWGFCSDFVERTITIVDPSSSVEDVDENSLITVYPNPASTLLNVNVGNAEVSEIQIMNAVGQIVYENVVNDVHLEIDVNHFTDGIYFIRFVSSDGKFTYPLKKFMKRR